MNNKQFADGIRAFKPGEKSPNWIIANLVINKPTLQAFLNTVPEDFKLVMKESKKGGYYLEVDTFEPKTEPAKPAANKPGDDLPF